ncbi:hypothetical protein AAVH_34355, partial [Aphelenchoides avenae]
MTQQTREQGVLTLTVDNATEYFKTCPRWFTSEMKVSGKISLCGLEWKMQARRKDFNRAAWLVADIICSDAAENSDCKCKAACMLRIRSFTPNGFATKRWIEFGGPTALVDEWDFSAEKLVTIE